MATQVERLENSLVKLTIEVDKEAFAAAVGRAFKRNAKKFNIPGFRPGKAPLAMVKKYYGEASLYNEAFDDVAMPAYRDAVVSSELDIMSRPEINILSIGEGEGVTFEATVAVRPEVGLASYKGVTAFRPSEEVKDEQIELDLKRQQDRSARMVTVTDRPAKDGDIAVIDYKGMKDGVAFDGGTAEKQELKLGSGNFIPGFEEQVVGKNIGDEFEINVTFPEQYHEPSLAGAPVVFAIKLHELKERILPEIDDEFIKDISDDCDTVEAYKDQLKAKFAEENKKKADEAFENNLVKTVVDGASIDLAEMAIDDEAEEMLQDQRNRMQQQGFALEDYLRYTGQNIDDVKKQMREAANIQLRTRLVLEEIAKQENIEVSEEDYKLEIERLAASMRTTADELMTRVGKDNEAVKMSLKRNKAIDIIKDTAVATDVAPVAETTTEEAEQA